jgi:heterotetrameric sarcosine oxidase alpha subunit
VTVRPGRLPHGGRIERARPLAFTFDGASYHGFAGDTLASALLANGVRLVGRSFKYHRPRGIFSAGVEEPNALVTIGSGSLCEPNLQATTLPLRDGLTAESQNRWPSLGFDLQSVNGLFAPFLAAGFYYKTFMGPTRRSWLFYERLIRKAAGLGRASTDRDERHRLVTNLFTDVAVIGAGPAGLAAARAAAQTGARVTLVEQDTLCGGQLLSEPATGPAAAWLSEMVSSLSVLPNLAILTQSTAFGLYDGNVIGIVTRGNDADRGPALNILHAREVIFATGAIERALLFPGNDRPGVMLASAIRAYLNRFAVLTGTRVLLATSHDGAYQTALDLAASGASVTVADQRSRPGEAATAATAAGVTIRTGARVTATAGRLGVTSASIIAEGREETLSVDLVGVSGGWSPTVHLTSHLGGKPVYRADIDAFVPGILLPSHHIAGAVSGDMDTATAIAAGHDTGLRAAAAAGHRAAVSAAQPLALGEWHTFERPLSVTGQGKSFVDLQHDVTISDIELAHREGFRSVEHLKRYTTLGMATDQGKTSNIAGLSLMAELRGLPMEQAGTTTFRPPFTPVPIGALAGPSSGKHYKPIRRTPIDAWHSVNGAQMIEVGLWMRPWFYASHGKDAGVAYVAEMRLVRGSAGLMDISTLGKIEVQGPDAAAFIDRVYANGLAKLPVGKARYGVMLCDDGIVFDDGTATRLAADHFFITTSTSKAADVLSHLEFLLDTTWRDLRVSVTPVTDEWAAMSVAGPRSREILQAAFPTLDVSHESLPPMKLLEGQYEDAALRIIRLSYSGERAYEIYVGASKGMALWQHLLAVGKPFALAPYGVEALGALRVEKGHVAGPEIDGRTTAEDLGLSRMIGERKGFVGAVLRNRPAFREAARPRLVGLVCLEPQKRLRGGAILFRPGDRIEGHGRGRVTSVTYSPSLDNYVALGLFEGGQENEGSEVLCVYPMKNETVRARIASPHFLDPAGERLDG